MIKVYLKSIKSLYSAPFKAVGVVWTVAGLVLIVRLVSVLGFGGSLHKGTAHKVSGYRCMIREQHGICKLTINQPETEAVSKYHDYEN